MLSNRIIDTIRFFDLQDLPLTAFEVQRYLVADRENLVSRIDDHYELLPDQAISTAKVNLDTVQHYLDELTRSSEISQRNGFYSLPSRELLAELRLKNYLYGIPRERLIWRYLGFTKHIPFVRGIALAGSQALGLQRATSDIDLLIITESSHMWIARTMLTVYFQLMGVRRYKNKIANRFCLNHYLANVREVDAERNLYKAMEYTKLRLVVYPQSLNAFQKANQSWINIFFPNASFQIAPVVSQSTMQRYGEVLFANRFGSWLESKLGHVQMARIKQGKFIFVREDELSFHPDSKHETLLAGFFTR